MHWLSTNYQWVVTVIAMPIVLFLLKQWADSSKKTTSAAPTQAAPSAIGSSGSNSPVELESKPEPPQVVPANSEDRKVNIGYLGTETLCIVEYDSGVFTPRERALPAVLIKFSNDAVIGASTRAASLKATIVYRDAGNEILRVMGAWLELGTGHVRFEVDSSHKLIVCFVLNNELCTLNKYDQRMHRRTWWRADLHKLGNLEKFTALVRLTNILSGYCYFEGEFEVQKTPDGVTVIKTA